MRHPGLIDAVKIAELRNCLAGLVGIDDNNYRPA
jgi:hypothetical protein